MFLSSLVMEGWKVTFLEMGRGGGVTVGEGGALGGSVLWRSSTAVVKAFTWVSWSGSSGEFLLGCFKACRVSCVAAATTSMLDAVGILTSCGNHSRVSVIRSALVDQMWVV